VPPESTPNGTRTRHRSSAAWGRKSREPARWRRGWSDPFGGRAARVCGGFSSGGLPNAAAYAAWIRQVKADIGGRPATVIVEPDALPAADCTGPGGRTARFAAMADAVSGFDETTAAPDVMRCEAHWKRWPTLRR
jgi:cellulase/cellobiase CelA1